MRSGIVSDHLLVTNVLDELSTRDKPPLVTSSIDSGGVVLFSVVAIYSTFVEVIFTSLPLIRVHVYFDGSVLSASMLSVYCPMYFLSVPTVVSNPVFPSAESAYAIWTYPFSPAVPFSPTYLDHLYALA